MTIVVCCRCGTEYDLTLYQGDASCPSIICPSCGHVHLVEFHPIEDIIEGEAVDRIELGPTYDPPVLARGRILDSSLTAVAADDADVTNWTKTDLFVVVAQIDEEKGPWNAAYKLRWRDVTDSGSFADLVSTGECKYTYGTDLSNDSLTTSRKCTSAPSGSTWQDGCQVEDGSGPAVNLADECYTEYWFGVSVADAQDGHEYEFEMYDRSNGAAIGTLACTLTTVPPASADGADGLSFTDVAVGVRHLVATATDSLSLGETKSGRGDYIASGVDTLTFDETVAGLLALLAGASDTLSLADVAEYLESMSASAADELVLEDIVSGLIGYLVSESDALALTDAAVAVAKYINSASDSVSLTDVVAGLIAFKALGGDELALSDTATGLRALLESATSSVAFADSADGLLALLASGSDTLSFSDEASYPAGQSASASDTLSLSDTASAIRALMVSADDTLSLSDATVGILHLIATAINNISLADTAGYGTPAMHTASVSDLLILTDRTRNVRRLYAYIFDALGFTDTIIPNIAHGFVTVTFTGKFPVIQLSGKSPVVTYTGKSPVVNIVGSTPHVSIVGKTPRITFVATAQGE